MSARLLVIGASGLVGGELVRVARARGYNVLGAARTLAGDATRTVDLADVSQVRGVISEFAPQTIAVCSAYPHVDGCEANPERSYRENVGTIEVLVDALRDRDTGVVFFSTDQVFDGKNMFYVEGDAVHPLNVYAQHKRRAEELLLARGKSLIVRTAWVFGRELRRKNFFYTVQNAAREQRPLRLPEAQSGCPTSSDWLAQSTLSLLERGFEGVVHLTGGEPLSKAEWARLILHALKLPLCDVTEVSWQEAGQVAPRPNRVVLKSSRHALVHPPLVSVLEDARLGWASS